jgi:hypothetical protein
LGNQGSASLSSLPHDGNLAVLQEIGLQMMAQLKNNTVKPGFAIDARLKVGSALNEFAKGRGSVIN